MAAPVHTELVHLVAESDMEHCYFAVRKAPALSIVGVRPRQLGYWHLMLVVQKLGFSKRDP